MAYQINSNLIVWNMDYIFSTVSTILALISILFACFQWRTTNKIKRAEFVNQILEKIRCDKDISAAMYEVDYNMAWYNDDFHNNRAGWEPKIDKLLAYLSYACYLYRMKMIGNKEFTVLRYDISRVCISPAVQNYLWNLYHFADRSGGECSFTDLIDFGLKSQYIPEEIFLDPHSAKYTKRLNF